MNQKRKQIKSWNEYIREYFFHDEYGKLAIEKKTKGLNILKSEVRSAQNNNFNKAAVSNRFIIEIVSGVDNHDIDSIIEIINEIYKRKNLQDAYS